MVRDRMERQNLTRRIVDAASPADKAYEIRDASLPGFLLRVEPTGNRTFYVEWRRGRRLRIGRAGVFTFDQARTAAAKVLREVAETGSPQTRGPKSTLTLADFLTDHYAEWSSVH